MDMISITPSLYILDSDLEERFIRASGPGGQNVNKVATAVQLRFNLKACQTLPDDVKYRLVQIAGRRLTSEGILLIDARDHRSQEKNRKKALERLISLIQRATQKPISRKETRPPLVSRQRRIDAKRRRSRTKSSRAPVSMHDD
jgi:ribosome-associated protein